jgi:hypothetical protein
MRTRNVRLSRIALCVALAIGSITVQAQNTTAAVGGRITTAEGKPLAGATVTVLHNESGSVSRITTDADGRYHARGLRVGGPYTITVTTDGINEKREAVFLQLADTTAVDMTVPAPRRETIVVSATSLSDKFSATAMGAQTNIGRRELESLPRSGATSRTTPVPTPASPRPTRSAARSRSSARTRATTRSPSTPSTSATRSGWNPTRSRRSSNRSRSMRSSRCRLNVSNYDVTQTGYTGGNINAVTKSGTNELHGTASYVYRDDSMAGQRYIRGTDTYTDPPKYKEDTKGVTLGGPIIKDKLFFFLGYEELNSTRNAPDFGPIGSSAGGIVGITTGAITALQNLARSQYNIELGDVPSGGQDLVVKDYLAKLDWNINASHRASVRYTKTEQTEPIFQNFSATQIATTTNLYNQVKELETIVGQWFADWTPNFSTELKVSNRDYHSEPSSPTALPQMDFNYNGTPLPPGAPTGTNTSRRIVAGTERSRHFNILDTKTKDIYAGATWARGDHEIKGLIEYSDNEIYNAFLQDTKGNYVFSCVNSTATYTYSFGAINCATAASTQVEAAVLENFQRGRPSSYLVQVPLLAGGSLFDGVAQFHVKNEGFGLQDTWSVNPRLTLMYGVRVDTPRMPQKPLANTAAAAPTIAGSVSGTTVTRNSGGFGLDNTTTIDGDTLVQPRIGFNYSFEAIRPTQLRGGVGLFQGAAATVWISNIYSNTGVATRVVGCGTSGFAACPSAGGIFRADSSNQVTSFPGSAPAANVDFLQDNLGQPSVWKANLGLEHKLPWFDMVASIEYVATQNNSGIYYQHLNLGAPTRFGAVDGRPLFYTPTAYNPACWSATGSRTTSGAVCGLDNRARALANPNFNNVLLAAKSNEGKGQAVTAALAGRFTREWNWTLAYTYTEATEPSPLTSSVSNSNWNARSAFDPNANEVGNSAYLVKDRINAMLGFEKAFFGRYRTRFGMFYEGRTGKPYSWVFRNDMNGDANGGNDLMYIPRAFGSGDVIFLGDTAANHANEQRFWDIVNAEGGLSKYAGRVVERNSSFSPWTNSIDLRFSQEFPAFFPKHKATFVFDILNFGNMLNKKWGRIDEMAFQSNGAQTRTFVNFVGIDPTSGKYIYSVGASPDDFTTRQQRGESQWQMQVTFRYEF